MSGVDLGRYVDVLRDGRPVRRLGRVVQVVGLSIEAVGLRLPVGEICHIYPPGSGGGQPPPAPPRVTAEVVGFREQGGESRLILMPFGEMHGIRPGSVIVPGHRLFTVPVGDGLLGRVVDGFCRPIDGLGPLDVSERTYLLQSPPEPLKRARIDAPLVTGIRAIDGLLTCGKGQRVGIFAGSGVGKSTLLGMVARHTSSDVSVVALIGERGREVQDFIGRDLGPEGLKRSVVVVSTSDQPALMRIKAAWVATAIAEYFRDRGAHVVLLMDSLTRLAMAQREVGLAAGEPPTVKGYPPSVFGLLPKLLERAGTAPRGSITGFYTVLTEGDDPLDPIADTVRSILDGHIQLSRRLATEGHFPPIDVLESISRVMPAVATQPHLEAASRLRQILATYRAAEDLINIGAYVRGTNPEIDLAIDLLPAIRQFLRQAPDERTPFEETIGRMTAILAGDGKR